MNETDELIEKIHLYPGVLDSHTHLILLQTKNLEWERLLRACISSGLEVAMDIGTNTDTFCTRLDMCSKFPQVVMTDGLSVSKSALEDADIKRRLDDLEKQVSENISDPKLVGIGEIGLDNHILYGGIEKQKKLFAAQMEIARQYDLPVVIHTREADSDTYDILSSFKLSRGGIIHCFSSNYEWAKKYMDLGFYISFSGNITYKRSDSIVETAAKIPATAILAETDAPFLTPQKVRKYPNFSGFMGYTYDFIAQTRGCTAEDLIPQIRENFRTLTGF
ncbi:MAG: TatD family hydrolase [Spirochaetia bacterium]|nr:TatD family hydrolase [Spirochaetia bacterium]